MSEQELDAIEKRAKAATEGPWRADRDQEVGAVVVQANGAEIGIGWRPCESGPPEPDMDDAEFIARSRTDVPRLVAEVRRLQSAIRWALGEGDEFPPRRDGQGAYWWRTELGRRAGLRSKG